MNMHACVYGSRGVWLKEVIYAPDGGPSIRSRAWYRSHGHCTPLLYGFKGSDPRHGSLRLHQLGSSPPELRDF